MTLQGILLDIDGTLVLSNDAHARAWVDAFAEYGYEVPFERVRPLIGMGGDRLVPRAVPGLSEAEGVGKAIAQRRKEIFISRYAPGLDSANGARQLLLRMQRAGLRPVIASSAKKDELEVLLRAAFIDDLIETATTSDDAEETKPAPDIVEAALNRSGLASDQVLMLGDTPYDVESAVRSGVGLIALRCGGWDDAALAGALVIYDDPADLLAHYEDSPLRQGDQAYPG
jgi:phosphoglycolate phosphatase-like HAD superfamily hydrolase